MIDRDSLEEFLELEFAESDLEIPRDISREDLVEAFSEYLEDGYYEWLRDNFRSFFNDGDPDWEWIREQIEANE